MLYPQDIYTYSNYEIKILEDNYHDLHVHILKQEMLAIFFSFNTKKPPNGFTNQLNYSNLNLFWIYPNHSQILLVPAFNEVQNTLSDPRTKLLVCESNLMVNFLK